MAPRQKLQRILTELEGVRKVYFQPPTNVQLEYPCIVYRRDTGDSRFADNRPYTSTQRYEVTVIDQKPDSDIPRLVEALPMCVRNRFYASDDLNHDVFFLYF